MNFGNVGVVIDLDYYLLDEINRVRRADRTLYPFLSLTILLFPLIFLLRDSRYHDPRCTRMTLTLD